MENKQFDNTNRGVLFIKNKKSEKQPDYEGTINIDGRELSLAGWKKVSQTGATFLSLKVSEPRIEVNGQSVQREEVDF